MNISIVIKQYQTPIYNLRTTSHGIFFYRLCRSNEPGIYSLASRQVTE
jgi:hypothetical protein